ncbi:MAG: DNA-directed RNA polymerase subunit N [Candidatus Anstonellales archaeon]
MYFPIRCFTCGQLIAHKYEPYQKKLSEGKSPASTLDELNIKRYCCRRMFLSHVEVADKIIKYEKL